jgi:serpin B
MRSLPWTLLFTTVILVACSNSSANDLDADLVRSSLSRDTSPKLGTDDASTLASDDAKFALDLYHQLPTGNNLVFSPYSISIDLAMVYAGAAGTTADGMSTALDFTLAPPALHAAFDSEDLALSSRHGPDGGKPFQLSIANSLWVDHSLTLEPSFLDTLAVDYGTGVHAVDFQNSTDEARTRINDWVSEKTGDKIQGLIPHGGVERSTVLAVVNAVYFTAGWEKAFDESATRPGPFDLLDGTTTTANLMNALNVQGGYAMGDGYTAAELPYQGGQISLVIVLPDEGAFDTVESNLDGQFVTTLFSSLMATDLDVTLPRFTVAGATIDLKDELSKLGMSQAFAPDADFSAMTKAQVSLDKVFHQAFIQVDESGTTAAAATATTVTRHASIEEGIAFTVDRPFFYMLRDIPTNTVLFLGREVNPSG